MRGVCLRFREFEIGFGLCHFCFVLARINLHEQVTLFYCGIVVDEQVNDIAWNLRCHRSNVAVHLGVVCGDLAGEDVPRDDDRKQDHDDRALREGTQILNPAPE